MNIILVVNNFRKVDVFALIFPILMLVLYSFLYHKSFVQMNKDRLEESLAIVSTYIEKLYNQSEAIKSAYNNGKKLENFNYIDDDFFLDPKKSGVLSYNDVLFYNLYNEASNKSLINFNRGLIIPNSEVIISLDQPFPYHQEVDFNDMCSYLEICLDNYKTGNGFFIEMKPLIIRNKKEVKGEYLSELIIIMPTALGDDIYLPYIKLPILSESIFNDAKISVNKFNNEFIKFEVTPLRDVSDLYTLSISSSFQYGTLKLGYVSKIKYELLTVLPFVYSLLMTIATILLYFSFRNILLNRHKKFQEISEKTYKDSLTDCYNRHGMDAIMTQLDSDYFFVLVDGNGVKNINDTYGHKMGDEYITLIARSLKKFFRDSDYVIRLGGDEFLVIVQSELTSNGFIETKMSRVNAFLDFYSVINGETSSVSFGSVHSSESDDFEALLSIADSRMYVNKSKYRNREREAALLLKSKELNQEATI